MAALPSGITSANDGEFVVNGGKVYVAEGGAWERVTGGGNASAGGPLEVGSTITWTSTVLPASGDWVLADGRRLSAAAYPEAYAFAQAAVAADGASALWTVRTSDQTFTVPDLRNVFTYGAGYYAVGQRDGAATVRLTTNELPYHAHGLAIGNGAAFDGRQAAAGSTASRFVSGDTSPLGADANNANQPVQGAGGGQAHNNMPPFVATNYIVRVRNTAVSSAAGPKMAYPVTPWYVNGSAVQSIAANATTDLVPAAGGSSQIQVTAGGVDEVWVGHMVVMAKATTANWTPIFAMFDVMNGTTRVQRFQGRALSNTAAGNDYTTIAVPEGRFVVPAGETRTLVPRFQAATYAAQVNREPDYNSFYATKAAS